MKWSRKNKEHVKLRSPQKEELSEKIIRYAREGKITSEQANKYLDKLIALELWKTKYLIF